METSNSHIIEQALAAERFINRDLLDATARLAVRRGETIDDVMQVGWAHEATTAEEGYDTKEHISFEAAYGINEDGERGFTYRLDKITEVRKDIKECTVDELLSIYEVISDGDNEFLTVEQRQELLQLITAYVEGKLHGEDEVILSREMQLRCKAENATGGISIERSMVLWVGSTTITATSVGNVDIYEELPFPEDAATMTPSDVMILPSDIMQDIDLSTPTVDDIYELKGMLQMLGLADRVTVDVV